MARRILLLITDLQLGGTPTVVYNLATRLHRAPEIIVDVACLSPTGAVAAQLEFRNIRVFPLNARGPSDVSAIARLAGLLRRENYDTVFSFLVHANVAAALVKPFFPGVRFHQSIQTTQPYPAWHWKVQSVARHAADTVVVPSESAAEAAFERSHIPPDKIAIIPNAIDPADFADLAIAPDRETLFDRRPVPIGFIGRLDPIKRVPDLIDAVARLDDLVHLHVFGDGPQRPQIERQIAALRIPARVTLHGSVPHPADALRRIALLVLPSEAEGFGLVLIEAMAAGIPVIATDAPGIRNVATHNSTALLAPVGNPTALADAIRELLDNPTLRHRLTTTASAEVGRKFTWTAVLPRYRELLGLPTPSRAEPT